jgi:hypothetical protein
VGRRAARVGGQEPPGAREVAPEPCDLSAPDEAICDGIGELWFPSADAMNAALASPEMGAAVDDAKSFLDMERTGLIIVDERTILG